MNNFNAGGCRLLSKEMTDIRRIFPRRDIPKNATKACISKIETDFGKFLTTNSVFLDENDKLVGQIIEKKEGKKILSTKEFIFSGDNDTVRQISSKFKIDGVLKRRTFSRQVKIPTDNPETFGIYREKAIIEPDTQGHRKETQFFEQLKPHKQRKFIKTETSRDPYGELSNSTVSGNSCSEEELKELSKHPYAFAKTHSNDDFLANIFDYSVKKQDVWDRNVSFSVRKLNGLYGISYDNRPLIAIDLDACETKSQIVKTLNHELRHQYQKHVINKFMPKNIFEKGKAILVGILYPFRRKISADAPKSEKEFAQRCLDNFKHYVDSNKDYEQYRGQFVEIDARKAGETACKEYNKLVDFLDKIFPGAKKVDWPVYQFKFCEAVDNAPVVKILHLKDLNA
jgi:hypothetical protein